MSQLDDLLLARKRVFDSLNTAYDDTHKENRSQANEIERLREENEDFKALAREFHNGYITPDVCDTPPDELTALRELMTETVEITHHHLAAENERLREALDSVCNRLVGSFGVGVASEMACEERWRALHPGEERGDE